MITALSHALESHGAAATLYLHGALLPESAVRAFRACYTLPAGVRRLHVDLRGVCQADAEAAETLAILLAAWRRSRAGVTRLELPGGALGARLARIAPRRRWHRIGPLVRAHDRCAAPLDAR